MLKILSLPPSNALAVKNVELVPPPPTHAHTPKKERKKETEDNHFRVKPRLKKLTLFLLVLFHLYFVKWFYFLNYF